MKFVRQFAIILLVTLISELLCAIIPIHVPTGAYGIVLLFLALYFQLIKPEQIRECGYFLIALLPILFIPPGSGLLAGSQELLEILLPFGIGIVGSSILVLGISGLVTQKILLWQKKATGKSTSQTGETPHA